jgi:protein TonB
MLSTLLESRAARTRRAGGVTLSVATHAALVALAAVATGSAATSRRAPRERVIPLPSLPAPAPAPLPPHSAPARRGGAPGTFAPASALPTVPALPAVGAIVDELPTVAGPAFDPGVFDRGLGRATDGRGGDGGPGTGLDDGPLTEHAVDRPVLALAGSAAPRYPEPLRLAGVEGRVVARFVVDTLGRVEPGSVTVVRATHAAFATATVAAVGAMRFVPAEARGRRVRQLVEQPFEFRLDGR